MTNRDPQPHLPLSPPVFHVLLSLSQGERHGYLIMKEVEERTSGSVRLSTGTLYGIIKRLLAEGLAVESRQRPPAAEDDERRRYYRLTPFGRKVVAAETERLEAMVGAARATQMLRRASS